MVLKCVYFGFRRHSLSLEQGTVMRIFEKSTRGVRYFKEEILMREIISALTYWFVVPMIILSLFMFALSILSNAPNKEAKTSAEAGLWSGIILFIMYVITQLDILGQIDFSNMELVRIQFWPVLAGMGAGFVIILAIRLLMPSRQVGIVVLFLVTISTCSFYSYIFLADIRNVVLCASLGFGLGALLHVIVFPSSLKHLF